MTILVEGNFTTHCKDHKHNTMDATDPIPSSDDEDGSEVNNCKMVRNNNNNNINDNHNNSTPLNNNIIHTINNIVDIERGDIEVQSDDGGTNSTPCSEGLATESDDDGPLHRHRRLRRRRRDHAN